jgi:hypothetical protein
VFAPQLGMAATSLVLALAVIARSVSLERLRSAAFVLTEFFAIAHGTVRRSRHTAALAFTTLSNQSGSVVGPAIAGILIANGGL